MSNSKLSGYSVDELLDEVKSREYLDVDMDEDIKPDFPLTHTECVEAAARYMGKRNPVVLPEFFSHNAELPDVIAFSRHDSTMIECKVSRSDFLHDAKKAFRVDMSRGMGDFRYYCCPKGLIRPQELPQGWGLLYVYPDGSVRKQREARQQRKNLDAEHYLLFYYARRANYAGVHKTIVEYRGFDA